MDELFNFYHEKILEFLASRYQKEGALQTEIPSLSFYSSTKTTDLLAAMYEPSLCIVINGSKIVHLKNEVFEYNPNTYLFAYIYTPAKVRIKKATKKDPYLSLKLTFSIEQIFDLLRDMNNFNIKYNNNSQREIYLGKVNGRLLESVYRLIRLLDIPKDIPIVAPLVTKEILYIATQNSSEDFIRRYILDGSTIQRIIKVISKIKHDFREKLDVPTLAKIAGMSESSLYHNFKKITNMSPIQFQKMLRLYEARQMLTIKRSEIAEVAFEVGYDSPSQFSREYSRIFGLPPKFDAKRL